MECFDKFGQSFYKESNVTIQAEKNLSKDFLNFEKL